LSVAGDYAISGRDTAARAASAREVVCVLVLLVTMDLAVRGVRREASVRSK